MSFVTKIRQKSYGKYVSYEMKEHNLLYLFLELTRRCNLNCIHCGSDCTKSVREKELTTESWLLILDYLKKTFDPLPVIVLTGGEPTIHPGLPEITGALQALGFPWGMVTNGFNLTEKKLSSFVERGIDSITLSYDGDRDSINYIRNNPKAYEKIETSLKLIGNSGINVKDAVTCVYPGNLAGLSEIADHLLESGMNSHRLFRIFPKGRAELKSKLSLDFNQSQQMINWIKQNRILYRKQGLNLSFSCEGYLPYKDDLQVRDEPFFCRSGISIASILSNGSITGCNNNGPGYYQGNILTDNFASLWQNKFVEYRDKSWLKTGLCKKCSEWTNCLGSSIHLRNKESEGPEFCYIHDTGKE